MVCIGVCVALVATGEQSSQRRLACAPDRAETVQVVWQSVQVTTFIASRAAPYASSRSPARAAANWVVEMIGTP